MSTVFLQDQAFTFRDVLDVLDVVIDRRRATLGDDDIGLGYAELLLNSSSTIVPYLIINKDILAKDVWAPIRKQPDLIMSNFLMTVSEFFLHLSTMIVNYKQANFATVIAEAVAINNVVDSSIDDTLLDQSATVEDIATLFKANPWYLFLVIVSLSGYKHKLIIEGESDGKSKT
jgi:hypothetical protein